VVPQTVGAPKEAWSTSSSPLPGADGGTPARLLVGVSHGSGGGGGGAFANPVHPSNLAAAAPPAPIPTDAAGVPVRNPFNG
jgi:hypothetical protein